MVIVFFIVSLLASVVGAVCGIGGGVIIKPALDLFQLMSVASISFLSGCTVLSMTCYSVGRTLIAGESAIEVKTATPLAVGAAVGGTAGKYLFTAAAGLFPNVNTVGAVQAVCLLAITLGALIYTLKKASIPTRRLRHPAACGAIGLSLGVLSSFLGIGGGPINLVVLSFCFSMDTKTAAQNSLYVILFSQTASLFTTMVTGTVPDFAWHYLVLMVVGGVGGGILGRWCNKRMDNKAVDRLFIGLMCVILLICAYNGWQYARL